ncbi:MAG: glycosyltransferase [Hahellaceae bacterium]|nr:glycosyltransferase [Hahellaceae bacterium]MCP5211749.1 glycosyltransferase [Hahellaceae bacterium]
MKRLLLINDVNEHTQAMRGVYVKLLGQAKALSKLGFVVDVLHMSLAQMLIQQWCDGEQVSSSVVVDDINCRDQSFFLLAREVVAHCEYDVIFTRYVPMLKSDDFLRLMICAGETKAKNVIEFPTMPYDQEHMGNPNGLKNDLRLRKLLQSHVDGCLTSSMDNDVFGIPAFHFSNKIDVDNFVMSSALYSAKTTEIHMIAVAMFSFWHGYDRLLEGLAFASPEIKNRIRLHFVGIGPEKQRLEALAMQWGIGSHVVFYGMLSGAPLDNLYAQCHVGVGALGLHRKHLFSDSSLKHREYCARGLPFVRSGDDIDFDQAPFNLLVPGNDLPINIDKVASFLESLSAERVDYREIIRAYALKHLSWEDEFRRLAHVFKR